MWSELFSEEYLFIGNGKAFMQRPEKNLLPRLDLSPGAPDTGTAQRGRRAERNRKGREGASGRSPQQIKAIEKK